MKNEEQMVTALKMGAEFGTSALDNYKILAARYDWNLEKTACFEPRHLLYGMNADSAGRGVWFLAHSNYVDLRDTNGIWKNTIYGDKIFEEWIDPDAQHKYLGLLRDMSERIVFVKKQSGRYYFLGVFIPSGLSRNDKGHFVKTFERISDTYPV